MTSTRHQRLTAEDSDLAAGVLHCGMTRVKEVDFVARHAFQRLSTSELRADPALSQAGVAAADVDNNGEIAGAPELSSLYKKLLALEVGATATSGVDLDAPSVKPVYSALSLRFSQQVGVESALGTKTLAAVPELSAVSAGAATMQRRDGVRQLGMGSVQDALNVIAAAAERVTGQPSLLRINLGANNVNRGMFGPGSEGVVKRFQQQEGLPATGVVDVFTLKAIDRSLATARTPTPTPPTPTPPTPPTPPPAPSNARFSDVSFQGIAAGTSVMRAGDRGPAVVAVQQALLDMGFPMLALRNDVGVSGVDGDFGGQTTTAIQNFQVHARKTRPDVRVTGVVDRATMRALQALAPAPGAKAWDAGQPNQAPPAFWNGDRSKPLRVVVAKDEHRTFLYDRQGACVGIFPNAHGSAGNATQSGLKKIRTRLDEVSTKATGQQLWGDERAFGKRIVDLSWASGTSSGEELHGSFDYRAMGKDVSHGCVRHYNEDILTIFASVGVGDLVAISDGVDDPMLAAPAP